MENRESPEPRKQRSCLSKLLWILGIGGFIMLVLAIAVPYFLSSRCSPGSACDRSANADVSKLSASLERFGNELVDQNCDYDAILSGFGEERIAYLVGPYYGWAGTSRRCDVRIRVKGKEIRACAVKGIRPDDRDPKSRYIYRYTLSGTDLPVTKGPCDGKTYGGLEELCYTSTMLRNDCTLRKPKDAIKCKDVRGDQ